MAAPEGESKIMGQSVADLASSFASGFAAAAASKTIVAPLDRAKLILQTQQCNYAVMSGETERYRGTFSTLQRMAKEQGVTSLWRGNSADVMRYAPMFAFNFLFRDWFKMFTPQFDRRTDFGKYFVCNLLEAGVSGVAALALLYPFDTMRTRLAADTGSGYTRQYRGFIDCWFKTIKLGGPLHGLYPGISITSGSVFVYRAVYLGGFTVASDCLDPQHFTTRFIIAQGTTLAATTVAYPLDTVRRRIMLQPGSKEQLYRNGRDCIRRILADEGPRAFFHGYTANLLRGTGPAFIIAVYSSLTAA